MVFGEYMRMRRMKEEKEVAMGYLLELGLANPLLGAYLFFGMDMRRRRRQERKELLLQ